jgi:ATP-binding cassette subfamily F protein 3
MILLKNVTFGFGDRIIFDNLNFAIKGKDKIGLIGRNGAGKSTLFKLITKDYELREGSIDIPKGYSIAHLKQERTQKEDNPIIDIVVSSQAHLFEIEDKIQQLQKELSERTDYETDAYMDLVNQMTELNEQVMYVNPNEIKAKAEQLLKGLGFKQEELTQSINTFSGGWQMRVELASILLETPDLLLLDEPTNYLDIESIIWFENYLKDYPGSFVIISHDRDFLDHTTKKTIELIQSKLHVYNHPFSKAQVERVERHEMMKAAYQNQQKVIVQKQRTIDRFKAKATKTSMAQSMEKQLAKMEKIEWQEESTAEMKIRFLDPPRSAGVVFKGENVSKAYDEKQVFQDIDLEILRGEKVALVGQNGQGKSTMVKIITDKIKATSGNVDIGTNVAQGIFYQDQTSFMDGEMTVEETLQDGCPPELRTKIRSILGAFLFSGEDVDKKVRVLSGGEKTRLCLAKLLLNPYNFILLDEPTNHLDMASKTVLQLALKNFKGTLLVVSHDRFFLRNLTEKTLEMRDGKLNTFLGDIDYFLDKRQAENFREVEKRQEEKKKVSATHKVIDEDHLKDLKKKLTYAERDIEKTENQLKEIEIQMGDPDFYSSDNKNKVINHHNDLKENLGKLNEKWEVIAEEIMKIEE